MAYTKVPKRRVKNKRFYFKFRSEPEMQLLEFIAKWYPWINLFGFFFSNSRTIPRRVEKDLSYRRRFRHLSGPHSPREGARIY